MFNNFGRIDLFDAMQFFETIFKVSLIAILSDDVDIIWCIEDFVNLQKVWVMISVNCLQCLNLILLNELLERIIDILIQYFYCYNLIIFNVYALVYLGWLAGTNYIV